MDGEGNSAKTKRLNFPHKVSVVKEEGSTAMDFSFSGMGIDHNLVFSILSNLL